ncbi:hypothetical protein L6R29_25140 [Myxococcota bacterium]|nr:hypothetical protein [Myxococcota bacterium]
MKEINVRNKGVEMKAMRQGHYEMGKALSVLGLGGISLVALFLMFGDMDQLKRFYFDGGHVMHPILWLYVLSLWGLSAFTLRGGYRQASGRSVLFFVVVGSVVMSCVLGWVGTLAGFRETMSALDKASVQYRYQLAAQYVSISMNTLVFGGILGGLFSLIASVWSCWLGWGRGRLESTRVAMGGIIAVGGLAGAFWVAGGNASQAMSAVPLGGWLVFGGAVFVGVIALGYQRKAEQGEAAEGGGEQENAVVDTDGWMWGAWLGALGAPMLLGYAVVWVHLSQLLRALESATADQKEALCRSYASWAGQAFGVVWVIVGGMLLMGLGMLVFRGGALKDRASFVCVALFAVALCVGVALDTERRLVGAMDHAREAAAAHASPRSSIEMFLDPNAPKAGSFEPIFLRIAEDGKPTMARFSLAQGASGTQALHVTLQTDRRATLATVLGALRLWVEEQIKKQPRSSGLRYVEVSWVVKRVDSRYSLSDAPKYPRVARDLLKPLMWPQVGAYRLQLSIDSEIRKGSQQTGVPVMLRIRPKGVTFLTKGTAIGAGCDLNAATKTYPTCERRGNGWDQACLLGCLKKLKKLFPHEALHLHLAQSDARDVSLLAFFGVLRSHLLRDGVWGAEWLFPRMVWVLDETLATPPPAVRAGEPVKGNPPIDATTPAPDR